jgi:hypothetical protein
MTSANWHWDSFPILSRKNWRKSQSLQAKVRTTHIPNTKSEALQTEPISLASLFLMFIYYRHKDTATKLIALQRGLSNINYIFLLFKHWTYRTTSGIKVVDLNKVYNLCCAPFSNHFLVEKLILLRPCVAQRLDAGFPPRRPGFAYGQHVGLWWTKRHCGRFSPSTSVSPANHSTDFSIIIITRGW